MKSFGFFTRASAILIALLAYRAATPIYMPLRSIAVLPYGAILTAVLAWLADATMSREPTKSVVPGSNAALIA